MARTNQASKINHAAPDQGEATRSKAAAAKSAAVKRRRQDKVGPGHPPRESLYAPGQSGNPGGRPPGVVSLKKSVEKVLSQKINYEVDGKTGRVSRLEALLTEHAIMGIKGDVRSAVLVLNFAAKALIPKETDQLDDTTSSRTALPSWELFAGLDEQRISGQDMIDLARLSAIVDSDGLLGLSPEDFTLVCEIRGRSLGQGATSGRPEAGGS